MGAGFTSQGEAKIAQHQHSRVKKYIATDEVFDSERRKALFEPCWPAEAREIAVRYQLDHTLGVAHARQWAARWRDGVFGGSKRHFRGPGGPR